MTHCAKYRCRKKQSSWASAKRQCAGTRRSWAAEKLASFGDSPMMIAGWHCWTPEKNMEVSNAFQKSGKLALVGSYRQRTPKFWHCRLRRRQSVRSKAEPRRLGRRLHGREAQAVVAGRSRAAGKGSFRVDEVLE